MTLLDAAASDSSNSSSNQLDTNDANSTDGSGLHVTEPQVQRSDMPGGSSIPAATANAGRPAGPDPNKDTTGTSSVAGGSTRQPHSPADMGQQAAEPPGLDSDRAEAEQVNPRLTELVDEGVDYVAKLIKWLLPKLW